MHAADPQARLGPPDEVTTGAELVSLLREHHDELRTALERLPDLSGAARDDEFWQVRRRLAVHQALESLLVSTGSGDDPAPIEAAESVLAAERLDTDDPAFGSAAERVLLAHQRHTEQQEPLLQSIRGELSRVQRDVAGTAVALWLGEGDTYLGHDYRAMVAAARAQLEDAASPGHGPRP